MKYRTLGSTDLNVSEICLGSMTWGQQNTEEQGHEQIDFSLEKGINFIDTAELYAVPPSEDTCGKTEEIIGSWFKKSGKRSDVILASKVVGAARSLPWIRNGNAVLDRANMRQALEGSLTRLQTDYIDLYQLHWSNRDTYHFGKYHVQPHQTSKTKEVESFHEVLETLDELVKEGKIRHCGLSNETAWGTMQYLSIAKAHNLPMMQSIQNEYSLLCRIFDFELAEVSYHENVGLLAWSPLAAGALSGKYLDGNMPPGSRRSISSVGMPHRQTVLADNAIRAYQAIAHTHNLDVCQMAISYLLQKPFMTSVIIGATTMSQLETNIAAADLILSDEVIKEIDSVFRECPVPY